MKKLKIFLGLLVAILIPALVLAQAGSPRYEFFYKSMAFKTYQFLGFGNEIKDAIGVSGAQTRDALIIGVNPTARALHITDFGDMGFNFAGAAYSNPSLVIHSANQSTTEYMRFYHDGTDGHITTGTGNVIIDSGFGTSGDLYTTGNLIFEGSGVDTNETTLTVSNPNSDKTITLPNATGFVAVGGNVSVPQVPNQDCNTTCGTGTKCLFGQDGDASGILRNCASATSDVCVCIAQ